MGYSAKQDATLERGSLLCFSNQSETINKMEDPSLWGKQASDLKRGASRREVSKERKGEGASPRSRVHSNPEDSKPRLPMLPPAQSPSAPGVSSPRGERLGAEEAVAGVVRAGPRGG